MDAQFLEIAKQIEAAGVSYWLNSGTLLGVVRDGRLIDGDGDIDISAWWHDEGKILKLADRWKGDGYQVTERRYKGQLCKVKAEHGHDDTARTIDIDIYRLSGNHAWCPQHVSKVRPQSLPHRVLRPIYYGLAKALNRSSARGSTVSKESGLLYRVYTWWIPACFFQERDVHVLENVALYIPSRTSEYLAFRYGDWRTPNPGWICESDDRGLVTRRPEELFASDDAVRNTLKEIVPEPTHKADEFGSVRAA